LFVKSAFNQVLFSFICSVNFPLNIVELRICLRVWVLVVITFKVLTLRHVNSSGQRGTIPRLSITILRDRCHAHILSSHFFKLFNSTDFCCLKPYFNFFIAFLSSVIEILIVMSFSLLNLLYFLHLLFQHKFTSSICFFLLFSFLLIKLCLFG